ncbi:hypothetical protein ACOSQ3_002180 [Xanthoceras sorbifolium]
MDSSWGLGVNVPSQGFVPGIGTGFGKSEKQTKLCRIFADIKDSISLLSWTPLPIGWLKVNVDGSAANGIIYAGGVIRDHERNWVRGFSMNIGGGSILETELWGILEGLKMLKGEEEEEEKKKKKKEEGRGRRKGKESVGKLSRFGVH